MAPARWFSPIILILVIAGGAVGVVARALLTVPFSGVHPLTVPLLTMGINIVGSFVLGVVVGALGDRHPRWRAFLGTGAMGGFTTYSAFAVAAVTVSGRTPVVGLAIIAVSVLVGAFAAAGGLLAGGRLAPAPVLDPEPEAAE